MKKLLMIPILLLCLTGASIRNTEVKKQNFKRNFKYQPSVKVDKIDSLLKKL